MKNKIIKNMLGGLASLLFSVNISNGDILGKKVLATGNNPYNWSNISSIVASSSDIPRAQSGSVSNSFRVRCYFSNLSIKTNTSYNMNIFGNDGHLYSSTAVPTNGRAQADLFIGSPSLSSDTNSLNSLQNLYLSLNSTNGLVYALSFTNLSANAGQNITLTETNSIYPRSSIIGSIDSDSDGFRNDEEMLVGTDPYNLEDYFKITQFSKSGAYYNIRWNGSPSNVVDVYELNNLSSNQWNTVKRNVLNNSANLSLTNQAKFYRIHGKGQ
jgi:hypothetical protein